MRVQPRAWIALAIVGGYAAIMGVTWQVTGADYETVGSTASNALSGIVLPVALASASTAVTTYALGWWSPALREPAAGPRWLRLLPVLIVLTSVGTLLSHGFEGVEALLVLTLALGTLLVGFGEELTLRGAGIVALRGSFGEVGVWFFSSLLFGLLHALNVLFGQSVADTVRQIVFAFVIGSALYVIRRTTGTLVVCMRDPRLLGPVDLRRRRVNGRGHGLRRPRSAAVRSNHRHGVRADQCLARTELRAHRPVRSLSASPPRHFCAPSNAAVNSSWTKGLVVIYEVSARRTVRWADVPSGIVMEVARDRLDGLRLDVRHWPWHPSNRVIDDTDLALLLRFGAETSTGILIGPEDFDRPEWSRPVESALDTGMTHLPLTAPGVNQQVQGSDRADADDVDTARSTDMAEVHALDHRLAATGLKTALLSHWSALGGVAPLGLT